MDVEELLTFQPEKPGGKKSRYEDNDEPSSKRMRAEEIRAKGIITDDERERILKMVEEEPESDGLDEMALKKMILAFEKKVFKNQEMRIKFPEFPEKFMESEVELNENIQELHVVATVPNLYHVLVELNSVQSLLQLLNHENTDISIAVVDLLQEMSDVDALTESEEGANTLFDALLEGQVIALLVQNLERLDETVKEESDGVHNTLAIIENMTELRPETCLDAAQQGLMLWLLRRLKAKMPFDSNKLYASEILAILLQNTDENRQTLGELDGIDILLQQLAQYKRHDPVTTEEIETMENLFNCLCSALMHPVNRDKFLRGEGLQLMNLMLREKKMSRCSAVKVLDHAMSGPEGAENCQKFVDILGLRSIFPLFMKTPKANKKAGPSRDELEEHIVSIVSALTKNSQGMQNQRLVSKFSENDHEKVDRLMELHFKYLQKVRAADERIEKEKQEIKYYGGDIDDEQEELFYMKRLEAGLFTLQLVDYIMMEISTVGPSTVKQRVIQILNMRGGSIKSIKSIMRVKESLALRRRIREHLGSRKFPNLAHARMPDVNACMSSGPPLPELPCDAGQNGPVDAPSPVCGPRPESYTSHESGLEHVNECSSLPVPTLKPWKYSEKKSLEEFMEMKKSLENSLALIERKERSVEDRLREIAVEESVEHKERKVEERVREIEVQEYRKVEDRLRVFYVEESRKVEDRRRVIDLDENPKVQERRRVIDVEESPKVQERRRVIDVEGKWHSMTTANGSRSSGGTGPGSGKRKAGGKDCLQRKDSSSTHGLEDNHQEQKRWAKDEQGDKGALLNKTEGRRPGQGKRQKEARNRIWDRNLNQSEPFRELGHNMIKTNNKKNNNKKNKGKNKRKYKKKLTQSLTQDHTQAHGKCQTKSQMLPNQGQARGQIQRLTKSQKKRNQLKRKAERQRQAELQVRALRQTEMNVAFCLSGRPICPPGGSQRPPGGSQRPPGGSQRPPGGSQRPPGGSAGLVDTHKHPAHQHTGGEQWNLPYRGMQAPKFIKFIGGQFL